MSDKKILATLILDKHTSVSDESCSSATLIAKYTEGFFALTVTAGGTLVIGRERQSPTSINIDDLLKLVKAKHDGMIH